MKNGRLCGARLYYYVYNRLLVRNDFLPVVVSADRADLVREFGAVALRAFTKVRRCHTHIGRSP